MVYHITSSVKVMKYLWPWHVAIVDGPHRSVCISSLKFRAGGLILTLGIGSQVACEYMHTSHSVSSKSGSNLTPTMALLLTSLHALSMAMWPRHRWSSMTDMGSMVLAESSMCTTLYRHPWVWGRQPTCSPWGDVRSRRPAPTVCGHGIPLRPVLLEIWGCN